jgi:hypothetical protein
LPGSVEVRIEPALSPARQDLGRRAVAVAVRSLLADASTAPKIKVSDSTPSTITPIRNPLLGITQQRPAIATLHGSGGSWIPIEWPGGSGCGLSADAVGAPTAAMHTTAVHSIASPRLMLPLTRSPEVILAAP